MNVTLVPRAKRWLPGLSLLALCFIVYANNFSHVFQLDDGYAFVDNPWIRSLSYIPRYFVDPSTLTTYKPNADYRPVLQVTYALNYWLSGTAMWSWHLVQVLLHGTAAFLLYSFLKLMLGKAEGKFSPEAFAVSALFAVHPYASGVVNYNWARSSLLAAVFLLATFLAYGNYLRDRRPAAFRWSLIFFALALFTKVEAIAGLGVIALLEAIPKEPRGLLTDLWTAAKGDMWRRWLPFAAIAAVYLGTRYAVMPPEALQGTARSDVPPLAYFLTQLTVWWHYVLRWFSPVNLIADNTAYPVYRSLGESAVLLALAGWAVVLLFLDRLWKTAPVLVFCALSAFVLITPTSSIAPLAEMANEHRPYLPLALLSAVWVIPAVEFFGSQRKLGVAAWAVLLVAFATLTWDRNELFQSEEAYWKDVVLKSPSARAHNNYGLALMKRKEFGIALAHFQEAEKLAPQWFIPQINLGIILMELGRTADAAAHYHRAVELDRVTDMALGWRGDFYRRQGEFSKAIQDYRAALPRAADRCTFEKKIADVNQKAGNPVSPSDPACDRS